MNDADTKKLDQIIVMLADMVATFGGRFDKIDGRLAKHDQRFDTIDDRLLRRAFVRSSSKLKVPRRSRTSKA
jgi:hypothetical protein